MTFSLKVTAHVTITQNATKNKKYPGYFIDNYDFGRLTLRLIGARLIAACLPCLLGSVDGAGLVGCLLLDCSNLFFFLLFFHQLVV